MAMPLLKWFIWTWVGFNTFTWTYKKAARWYTGWELEDKAWEQRQIQKQLDMSKGAKRIELKEGDNYF